MNQVGIGRFAKKRGVWARQIMAYLGTKALSVYGVIVNISTFVQCCAYSVGQASQPILSTNFGAGKGQRIRQTLRYALGTTTFFGLFWTVLCLAVPNCFIHLFMAPTPQVLEIAPMIIRCCSLSFLLLPLNIFSTYYFQAVMKPDPEHPFTAHTTNPVPFLVAGLGDVKLRQGGVLADIAPTMLKVMGLPQPEEMTGKSIIE